MAFRCSFCENLTPNGEPCKLVVTEWRKKSYPSAELPKLPGTTERRFSRAGEGYEVAEEKRACKNCVRPNAPAPEPLKRERHAALN